MAESSSNWRFYLFVLVLFLISYALVWALGSLVFHKWDSPMHFLVPIPAFFLAFWLLQWIEPEFGIKKSSWIWPVLIFGVGFIAFFIAQAFYWCNGLTDISGTKSTCSSAGMTQAMALIGGQWMELLTRDAYLYFLLMVFLAWASVQVLALAVPEPVLQSGRKPKKAR